MSAVRHFCRCKEPARQIDGEGISHCNRCGELLPEPVDVTLPVLIRHVASLERAVDAAQEEPPRLALTKAEAAKSLGVSVDFFEEHVLPELCPTRRGRRVLVAVAELERWLTDSAEAAL